MPALMVFNPRRAKKRKGASRGRRKMTAKQLKFFGTRRQRGAKRGSTARRKKSSRPRQTAIVFSENPKGKRMAKKRRRHGKGRRFRNNPKRVRRFRRNPTASGFLSGTLLPAAIGAGGALAVDLAIGNLTFIPASMKTGTMLPLTRIGLSLGLGYLVGMVAGDEAGANAAAGGIVVTVYSMAKTYLTKNMPNVKLARYVPMNRYVRMNGMGFVQRRNAGMGTAPRMMRKQRLRGLAQRPGRNLRGVAGLGYFGPVPTFNGGGSRRG